MKEINNWYSLQRTKSYRQLTADEISWLEAQGNSASDWGEVNVAEGFDAGRVHRCRFDGRIDIGEFSSDCLRYGYVTVRTGLYGSCFNKNTFIGDNAAIHNLQYCGKDVYIGNSVIISNVCEISMSSFANFGMGDNNNIDIVNENGGRAILASPGMTCTDAYIWAKYRDDGELMGRLAEITCASNKRPWCAVVGEGAVILNTKAVRGSLVGPGAVIDGAELVYNSTILSDKDEKTFVGSAVQIRNSIVGYGNKIDSAAQLETVMTGTAAALAQSTRITHSVIGDNAHVACCEIANSLIMPSHAQHHNSSFLIAALVGGQSNIASGATVGSNHNSRVNDGEIWAGRGFWPGLCVSLKHNSRFASFTMIAKGSYSSELDVRLPFTLVAIDNRTGDTILFPAYWFTHNMYATMRCAQKFVKRDKRIHRRQFIEHDILAPDTVEEMFTARSLIELWVGKALLSSQGKSIKGKEDGELAAAGRELLTATPARCAALNVKAENVERGSDETLLKHPASAYNCYGMMIRHYCAKNILPFMRDFGLTTIDGLLNKVGLISDDDDTWLNCGSAVISEIALDEMIYDIKKGEYGDTASRGNTGDGAPTSAPTAKKLINTWDDVHDRFDLWASNYRAEKVRHALRSLARLANVGAKDFRYAEFGAFVQTVSEDCKKIANLTLASRAKDFTDPFRMMVYDTKAEAAAVLGTVEDSVVKQTIAEMEELAALAHAIP